MTLTSGPFKNKQILARYFIYVSSTSNMMTKDISTNNIENYSVNDTHETITI